MTRQWPDFNEHGDLPPGIHQATLAEVVEHFGQTTPQRQIMAHRLEHIYTLASLPDMGGYPNKS